MADDEPEKNGAQMEDIDLDTPEEIATESPEVPLSNGLSSNGDSAVSSNGDSTPTDDSPSDLKKNLSAILNQSPTKSVTSSEESVEVDVELNGDIEEAEELRKELDEWKSVCENVKSLNHDLSLQMQRLKKENEGYQRQQQDQQIHIAQVKEVGLSLCILSCWYFFILHL
jgi:hypothetical protein